MSVADLFYNFKNVNGELVVKYRGEEVWYLNRYQPSRKLVERINGSERDFVLTANDNPEPIKYIPVEDFIFPELADIVIKPNSALDEYLQAHELELWLIEKLNELGITSLSADKREGYFSMVSFTPDNPDLMVKIERKVNHVNYSDFIPEIAHPLTVLHEDDNLRISLFPKLLMAHRCVFETCTKTDDDSRKLKDFAQNVILPKIEKLIENLAERGMFMWDIKWDNFGFNQQGDLIISDVNSVVPISCMNETALHNNEKYCSFAECYENNLGRYFKGYIHNLPKPSDILRAYESGQQVNLAGDVNDQSFWLQKVMLDRQVFVENRMPVSSNIRA